MMKHYIDELAAAGLKVFPSASGGFWYKHEGIGIARIPTFSLAKPKLDEVRSVLHRGRAALATYIIEPDDSHPTNALLYRCTDQSFNLNKLSKNARRDVRCAQRELIIQEVDWSVILTTGYTAYQETRARVGLSDGTFRIFQDRFTEFARCSCHRAIGAWYKGNLIAFMSLRVVEDWVEIEGSFSVNAERHTCPNDGLSYYVINKYLVENRFNTITYGLSSLQDNSNNSGMHRFKTKVGFEARPVHRKVVWHPALQFLVSQPMVRMVSFLHNVFPRHRKLAKLSGAMNIGKTQQPYLS